MREIARAFLSDEATIAQRIVRAKRQIRTAASPSTCPVRAPLRRRLDSVLDVLYFMFNEGYAALEGAALIRHHLCGEALRLARLVASQLAGRAARARARGAHGAPSRAFPRRVD